MTSRLFSLLCALLSVFVVVTTSRAAAAESVTLHSAFLGNQSTHGCTQHTASFDILTTSFGNQKSVYVHLKERDGAWIDIPATYIETIPDGREVWRAGTSYGQGACPTAKQAPDTFEFAVKVSTPSGDTWDSNGGSNYAGAKGSGSFLVGADVTLAWANVTKSPSGANTFSAEGFLRNLGYSKDVAVVYSVDGWITTNTAALAYKPSYQSGYGYYASPNANGVEVWGLGPSWEPLFTFAGSCVDFVIRYRVNGAEFWDNNFGRNHRRCVAP